MIKIGIKIGPISNMNEFEETVDKADFIELYGRTGLDYSFVKKYKKPIVVHAPNYGECVNYANSCKEAGNLRSLSWAIKTANDLESEKIVVHSELIESECCSVENTIDFLKQNFDERLHIENMPYSSMGHVHIGASPEEIERIIKETGIKFCLDFSHAAEYAAYIRKDYQKVVETFLKFKPNHFHLSDSNLNAVFNENFDEVHLNFFKGNIDLNKTKELIPNNAWVTLETVGIYKEQIKEIEFLRGK